MNNSVSQIMTVLKWTTDMKFDGFCRFCNCPKITWIALQLEHWIVRYFHGKFVIAVKAEAILSYAGSQTENQGGGCLPSSPTLAHPEVVTLDQLFQPHQPTQADLSHFSWVYLQLCATGYCLLLTRSFLLLLFSRSEIAKVVVAWFVKDEQLSFLCQCCCHKSWSWLSVRHSREEQRWESNGSELASSEVGDFLIPTQTQCHVSCWDLWPSTELRLGIASKGSKKKNVNGHAGPAPMGTVPVFDKDQQWAFGKRLVSVEQVQPHM